MILSNKIFVLVSTRSQFFLLSKLRVFWLHRSCFVSNKKFDKIVKEAVPFICFLPTDLALSNFLAWDTILLIKKGFKVFVVWCSRAREVLKWASFIFYR